MRRRLVQLSRRGLIFAAAIAALAAPAAAETSGSSDAELPLRNPGCGGS